MSIAMSLHLLAVVIWVGGIFFAYVCLRPVAASSLTPELRFPVWQHVFQRFFPWVWTSIITILITGLGMIFMLGGMGAVGIHVHIMLLLGIVMMLLFLHIFFSPYRKLKRAVAEKDWINSANALHKIRKFVLTNLILGLIIIIVGTAGRYF